MATKSLVLEAEDNIKPIPIPVPEWPKVGTVYILPLSCDELDAYDQAKSDKLWPENEEDADWRGVRALTVAMHLCDEDGTRHSYTDIERRELGRKTGVVLDRIYRECKRISRLDPSAIKEEEKNLPSGQTESSG